MNTVKNIMGKDAQKIASVKTYGNTYLYNVYCICYYQVRHNLLIELHTLKYTGSYLALKAIEKCLIKLIKIVIAIQINIKIIGLTSVQVNKYFSNTFYVK